jgi:hypothetical protein
MYKFGPSRPTHDLSTADPNMNSKMKEQRYDVLHDDVDNQSHRSDSSTEVEDSDAERAVRRRRQKRKKSLWRKVKGYHWVIDTALLIVIMGLLAEKRWSKHHNHTYELAGDISGFAPRCKNPSILVQAKSRLTRISLPTDRVIQARSFICPRRTRRVLESRDTTSLARHCPRGSRLCPRQGAILLQQPSPTHPRLLQQKRLYHLNDAPTPLHIHHPRRLQHAQNIRRSRGYQDAVAHQPLLRVHQTSHHVQW